MDSLHCVHRPLPHLLGHLHLVAQVGAIRGELQRDDNRHYRVTLFHPDICIPGPRGCLSRLFHEEPRWNVQTLGFKSW